MSNRSKKPESGFSLLEMIVAMALGTLVLGAATSMYVQGVNATWTVTQRAEMQQDFRAASNMLTKDLSLAGAGLGNNAAIPLATSGTLPVIGCVQATLACHMGAANITSLAYPTQSGAPYLYGLVTGYNGGPTINSLSTDTVTVAYTDSSFYLNCYTATVATSTTVTFALPGTTSVNCTSPTGNTGAQAINDSGTGLVTGDLVLFTFGAVQVVGLVTANASSTTATFASSDALKLNQASTSTHSLASTATGTTGFGQRLLVITYYIDNSSSPPILMRQIGGHAPIPVAENVAYMKFSYDLYNDTTNTPAIGCTNPGASPDGCATSGASSGLIPNQITKTNILHMAVTSTMKGAIGGYQGLDLETSVSARNLTYSDNYPQ